MKTSTILKRAYRLLAKPARWTKGDYAFDRDSRLVDPKSSRAVCWCVHGALKKFTPAEVSMVPIRDYLRRAVRTRKNLGDWNDDPKRTHQDVLSGLNRAINLALADGN